MSGIYIHIPFCKQACHYCDFHFSTSMKHKSAMVLALADEMAMRKNELGNEPVETLYFGGGTPSVLTNGEIQFLIDSVYQNFNVGPNPEITLEANPDDLPVARIIELAGSPINRLSIGIQSFFDDDLRLMNRAHDSAQARHSLAEATKYFDNISIDLIYGIPGMDNAKWRQNIETSLSFGIPHISSYALTVEPKTALQKLIETGKVGAPSDQTAHEHFELLSEMLGAHGFVHYELSNFGKQDYFSRNNSAYWLGKKYIGIGPSAHSYDGISRSWNVSNNSLYLKSIRNRTRPYETEMLSVTDRYNEYVMTGLRTIWGVSLEKIRLEFGQLYLDHIRMQMQKFTDNGLLKLDGGVLKTAKKGRFLTDGMASELFMLNSFQHRSNHV